MNPEPCRIVLVDGHAQLRQEVRRLLCEVETLEVVGEANDGLELFAFLESCPRIPHVVILDLFMPGLSGIETLQRVKDNYPEVKVLILTQHEEETYLREALSNGAEGYVVKEDAATELVPAIDEIRHGRGYISTLLRVRTESERREVCEDQ
jgi:DNA-binding NarL/FixJ family response regulator